MNTMMIPRLSAAWMAGALGVLLTACPGPQPVPDDKLTEKPEELVTRAIPELPSIPREVIDKSGIEEFEVDGLKVILKRTPASPVVSAQLFIEGGVGAQPADKAGIEDMALSVLVDGGTDDTPRDTFNGKLNAMGSGIGGSSNRDYSVITMGSIRPYFESTWALFAELVTKPGFDEKAFALTKERALTTIKSQDDDADTYMGNTAADLFFEGHPYKQRPEGLAETLEPLTREDLLSYFKGIMTRERLTLVVVGDVDRATLEAGITAGLGDLPKGEWRQRDLPQLNPGEAALNVQTRELPTNYMLGYFTAPGPTHPDYYPMLVGVNILSDRLFEEIRTKRNLTYAVSSGLARRPYNYAYFYITTAKPNEAIPVIYDEVGKLQSTPVSEKTLSDQVQLFLTEHFMGQETNAAQAATLGRYELTGGGWEQSLVFIERIKAVTPEQIQAVATHYIKNVHWGVIGNPEAIDPSILTSR